MGWRLDLHSVLYIPAAALEAVQQLIILATKPTKKHEILFVFSCDFVANHIHKGNSVCIWFCLID